MPSLNCRNRTNTFLFSLFSLFVSPFHFATKRLDLRITTDSQIAAAAASLDEYTTVRQQHLLEEVAATTGTTTTTSVGKSNYDAGIEYLDRNYGSVFDGKASNGDSLKNISGIMGK